MALNVILVQFYLNSSKTLEFGVISGSNNMFLDATLKHVPAGILKREDNVNDLNAVRSKYTGHL